LGDGARQYRLSPAPGPGGAGQPRRGDPRGGAARRAAARGSGQIPLGTVGGDAPAHRHRPRAGDGPRLHLFRRALHRAGRGAEAAYAGSGDNGRRQRPVCRPVHHPRPVRGDPHQPPHPGAGRERARHRRRAHPARRPRQPRRRRRLRPAPAGPDRGPASRTSPRHRRAAATMTTPLHRVLSDEGFRIFFPLSALYAALWPLAWVALWGFDLPFARNIPPGVWHANEMVFGAWGAALLGFLTTAAPEWTDTPRLRGGALWVLAE